MRDRYSSFVSRHEAAWELGMAVLAIVFVAVGFLADDAPPSDRPALATLDLALTVLFALEFGTRFLASRNPGRYLRNHWIDLVALVPAVRGVRVLRLLRLLRMVRAFTGIARAVTSVERLANHRGLVWLFAAWGAVMILCSIGLYTAENGVNQAITSPLDAMWWGITTMTTVGYGDIYPTTPEGRIAATILMVLGIGLYSAITATITSFMLDGRGEGDIVRSLERLRSLHAEGSLSDDEYGVAKSRLLSAGAD